MAQNKEGKNTWWVVGCTVQHKKTGQTGKLMEFKGANKLEKGRVLWNDSGLEQWVSRKQLKQVIPW